MNYCPDNWVVLKFTTHEMRTFYKVLGGWSGGYLTGDSWRLNSGITKVEEHDGSYYFYGFSSSVYRCGKESYGLRSNNAYVYEGLKDKYGLNVELMPEGTDFLTLSYGGPYQYFNAGWKDISRIYDGTSAAYRVKSQPKIETVTLDSADIRFKGFLKGATITFNLIDSVPDCNSIKMEKLK